MSFGFCFAAQSKTDSLEKLLRAEKTDSSKLKILLSLYDESVNKPQNAMKYAEEALALAQKIVDRKKTVVWLNNIGTLNKNKGATDKALENYQQALKVSTEAKDSAGMAKSLNNIGLVYSYQGDYAKTLEYYFASLNIKEKLGDKVGIAASYNNIGIVYWRQKEYQKSLENHFKSLEIKKEIGDRSGLAKSLMNIGIVYVELANLSKKPEDYSKALDYYLQSLKIKQQLGDKKDIASCLNNIGSVYKEQGDYKKALDYQFQCLKIMEELDDKSSMASVLINIGNAYRELKNYPDALNYYLRSLKISKEIGFKEGEQDTYFGMTEVYDKMNDYEKAYQYHRLYSSVKDSLFDEERSRQMTEMQTKYDTEKKDKELVKTNAELSQKAIERNAFIVGFILVLLLALIVLKSLRDKQKANRKLGIAYNEIEIKNRMVEEKNKDILDSIHYAKRIQNAILPSEEEVKQLLPDLFIFYRPKDIVSGDIYFIEQWGSKVFFAAVDCTGHGVPGAFMSIVAHNLINEALVEHGIDKPALILNAMDKGLTKMLKQRSDAVVRDGMDIALCALDRNTLTLEFAAANNPVWIISENTLTEIKPDKQPIGQFLSEGQKLFTNHELKLKKGDSVYVFSDGYADQFGGEKAKKFKYRQMQQLILSNSGRPMQEQKTILEETIENWRGNLEQVDDMLIIGVRV